MGKPEYCIVLNSKDRLVNTSNETHSIFNNSFQYQNSYIPINSYLTISSPYTAVYNWTGTTTTSANLSLNQCNGITTFCSYYPLYTYINVTHTGATTTTITQSITTATVGTYTMSFYTAARIGYNMCVLSITFNGTQIYNSGAYNDTTGTWNKYTTSPFTVETNGTYPLVLTFVGANNSMNITNIQLTRTTSELLTNGFFVKPIRNLARTVLVNHTTFGTIYSSYFPNWTVELTNTITNTLQLQTGLGSSARTSASWANYYWLIWQFPTDGTSIAKLYQSVNLEAGTYTLSFLTSSVGNTSILKVNIDEVEVYNFTSYTNFTLYTPSIDFTVNNNKSVKIEFVGSCSATTGTPCIVLGGMYLTQTSSFKQSLKYAIDWTFLPYAQQYKMSYTFACLNTSGLTQNLLLGLPDIGVISNNLSALSSTTAYSTSVVGIIPLDGFQSIYKAIYKNNSVIYCSYPSNNIFTVVLQNFDGTNPALTDDYVLILYFERV